MKNKNLVVLAYSGGLDTTFCLAYLKEKFNYEVIAVTFDLGQDDDFVKLKDRALTIGASKHILFDAKEMFANEILSYAVKANAMYEKAYPLHSSLQGYLISRELCKIAKKENAFAVAHGNTGLGND